ncbi:MAG TPA: hypothetical protein VNS22_17005 [Geminicoccus sp.]|nr:hypothetical protein [Geminicoccus sp.]HWL70067.1 hypothetical protein [Geminicoccus sp.]
MLPPQQVLHDPAHLLSFVAVPPGPTALTILPDTGRASLHRLQVEPQQ